MMLSHDDWIKERGERARELRDELKTFWTGAWSEPSEDAEPDPVPTGGSPRLGGLLSSAIGGLPGALGSVPTPSMQPPRNTQVKEAAVLKRQQARAQGYRQGYLKGYLDALKR
jgi:hypothetical protein